MSYGKCRPPARAHTHVSISPKKNVRKCRWHFFDIVPDGGGCIAESKKTVVVTLPS